MVRTLLALEEEELDNPSRLEMYLMQIAQTVVNSSEGKKRTYQLKEFALKRTLNKIPTESDIEIAKGIWTARTGMKPIKQGPKNE